MHAYTTTKSTYQPHSHSPSDNGYTKNTRKLFFAVAINIVLTVVQVIGGLLSGSLALIADALHNFSDAGALFLAYVARRIGGRPADNMLSYGYKRAEILGSLINSSTLVLVGGYLAYKSVVRYLHPQAVDGWIIVWVAGVALVIDLITAILTYLSGVKDNLNIRTVFIHNLSDTFGSVGVIFAGTLIIFYKWYIVDLLATVAISIYMIYHGILILRQNIRILMQAVPRGLSLDKVRERLKSIQYVCDVNCVHLWQLDDKQIFFEGRIGIEARTGCHDEIKKSIRETLRGEFQIMHSTIELCNITQ